MGKVPIVSLLVILLMMAISIPASAQQGRSQRTGGARAAYGEPVYTYTTKKKAKRKAKKTRRRTKKKDATINENRTKSPWVN